MSDNRSSREAALIGKGKGRHTLSDDEIMTIRKKQLRYAKLKADQKVAAAHADPYNPSVDSGVNSDPEDPENDAHHVDWNDSDGLVGDFDTSDA